MTEGVTVVEMVHQLTDRGIPTLTTVLPDTASELRAIRLSAF